jgi:glutaredoxin-like protein NrdH
MRIKLYSLPGSVCLQCRFTKRRFDELGIPYEEIPLGSTPGAMEYVRTLDYSSAPVVVVDLGDGATWSWAGYRPSQIELLAEKIGS